MDAVLGQIEGRSGWGMAPDIVTYTSNGGVDVPFGKRAFGLTTPGRHIVVWAMGSVAPPGRGAAASEETSLPFRGPRGPSKKPLPHPEDSQTVAVSVGFHGQGPAVRGRELEGGVPEAVAVDLQARMGAALRHQDR